MRPSAAREALVVLIKRSAIIIGISFFLIPLNTQVMYFKKFTIIETYIQPAPIVKIPNVANPGADVVISTSGTSVASESEVSNPMCISVEYEAFWYSRPYEYINHGDIPDLEPVDNEDDENDVSANSQRPCIFLE